MRFASFRPGRCRWAAAVVIVTLAPTLLGQELSFETETGTVTHTYREFRLSDVPRRPFGEIGSDGLPGSLSEGWSARARETNSDALILLRDGQVIFRYQTERGAQPIEIMSVTKAVTGVGIGRLIRLRQVSTVDQPVHRLFPEWRQGRKKRITLKHILSHCSGLEAAPGASALYRQPNLVQFALASEIASDPGTEFFYNNEAVNLLAGIAERATNQKLDEFMAEEVFHPLGIEHFFWLRDPAGNPHVMAGLRLKALDLVRIGQLMLHGGKIGDAQLLDPDWVRQAVTATHPDLHPRVGMSWFILTHKSNDVDGPETPVGFQANGYLGQYLVVVPKKRIVAVRLIDRGSHQSEDHSFPGFLKWIQSQIELL